VHVLVGDSQHGKGNNMRRKVEYRVEQETGVGWSDDEGCPYPVYTTATICGSLREAKIAAEKLREDQPLYGVTIVRDERTERVVATMQAKEMSGGDSRPSQSAC
jgi:hypothetical protein